jgi:hypothetical protein
MGGACSAYGGGAYRALVGKPEGRRPLRRPRRRWEDNIKMDLQEVGCGCMDWIQLAQDRDSWRALVNVIALIPGGSGYFTCIQNMTLVTTTFKSGGLHEKHVVALGKLGTTSAFPFRPRETKKNLCRGGRS